MAYEDIGEWKITLASMGNPELEIVFQDPQDLEVADFRRVQDANTIIMRVQRGSYLPEDSDMWAMRALDDLMLKSLLRWNLTDRRTKEPLPIKDVDDPFARVPITAYRCMIDQFRDRLLVLPKSSSP